ncbi:maleylpyruvate isomerase family mycothiol-dependent enzyme [Streptomyces sporangiiformans]|uniref:Maleylpyruvate isomerase family mycothiol-dependent enzyme n=2 Tax=Streptomyces sporangiiformans TaxID=2315329 RepID=A0A505D0R1_9ACTN|nr:maleylpyruvate isomerase family mycothiol-dependent enzyme [Streptomyces sporangiiformans]
MHKAAMWRVIDEERADLADLLVSLTPEQWACPSLCEGWTVRHVAAHLSLAPRARLAPVLWDVVQARGNFDRFVDNVTRREAVRPPADLVTELRAASGSRRLAPGQKLADAMMDVLVHGQDIAVPLGIDRPMPLEAARHSTEHVWRMGFPFHARKRLRGLRLVATDTDWSAGEGGDAVVEGPIAALLLLVAGRHAAALARLSGPGVAVLAKH